MARKLVVLTVLAALTAFSLSGLYPPAGAADKEKPVGKGPPPYVHAVVFTLKKDAPADEVETAIADCHAMLEKIATVRHLWAGRPAEKGTPKLARTDYQFALVIVLDDADGLQKYLEDPIHLKFVEKHGKYFDMDKLAVFDFANQAK